MAHAQIVVVDENDQPIGIFPKQEVWAKGLLHRIVRVMLEDEHGNLLLQKRSMQMDTAPGCWDHAAAGHVDAGEDYEPAAYRELMEELGIGDVKLEEVAKYRTSTTNYGGKKLNRFNKLFRGHLPHRTMHMHNDEVTEVRWFSLAQVKDLIHDHPDQVTDGIKQVIKEYY